MLKFIVFSLIVLFTAVEYVVSHGMVLNPVGRSSRWRFDNSAPQNWDDNQLYCGGFGAQHNINGGRCGFCGDDYRNPRPRANEHGGRFGQGVIVASYQSGQQLTMQIRLTANHAGHFEFSVCNMDNGGETEECFLRNPVRLANGAERYPVQTGILGDFWVTVQLPHGLTCNHCVLRWIYVSGNSWGWCGDGTGATGCGPQEQFRSCSDIRINHSRFEKSHPEPEIIYARAMQIPQNATILESN